LLFGGTTGAESPSGTPMTDFLILVLTVALYAGAAGFVRLCERM
jgi:hypothetical protein